MDAKRFGAFISERRKEHHMTQADLAGKVGVTDKAVSRWERGLGFPDINTMEPLAEALDVSLLELMRSEMQTTEGANVKKDEAAEKDGTVEMNEAAEKGWKSTEDMVAKIGRKRDGRKERESREKIHVCRGD